MNESLVQNVPAREIYDSAVRQSPTWWEARELWRFRSLLTQLVVNSFRMRYRRSALGIVWIFVNPLMNVAILSIVFSAVFKGDVRSYPLYVLVGFLVWNFYTQTTSSAIQTAISGNGLANRVYLPRTLYIVADTCVGAINLTLGLGPLALVSLLLQYPIPVTWVFFPVLTLFLILFTLGVGMLIGVLAVYFGDVAHMYQLVLPAFFFLTPIVYPISILPQPFQTIAAWNPLYWLILVARGILNDGQLPPIEILLGACAVSLVVFAMGWWVYARRAAEFVYYL